ncbi:hypothetical protein T06_1050 [Trichinella sp. T6]|nr:hypothetical protein T06_1050 [Trichinella sp. T6]
MDRILEFDNYLSILAMQWFIILHLNKSIRNLWCIGSVELNVCMFHHTKENASFFHALILTELEPQRLPFDKKHT